MGALIAIMLWGCNAIHTLENERSIKRTMWGLEQIAHSSWDGISDAMNKTKDMIRADSSRLQEWEPRCHEQAQGHDNRSKLNITHNCDYS